MENEIENDSLHSTQIDQAQLESELSQSFSQKAAITHEINKPSDTLQIQALHDSCTDEGNLDLATIEVTSKCYSLIKKKKTLINAR